MYHNNRKVFKQIKVWNVQTLSRTHPKTSKIKRVCVNIEKKVYEQYEICTF